MIDVRYEDDDIIVVYKPAGVDSQESRGASPDMVSEIRKYLKRKGSSDMYVGVVHRLDRPVSGIMVYAKNRAAAADMSKQLQRAGHMDKTYLALVEHAAPGAVLKDYISFEKTSNTSYVCDEKAEGAKYAELSYETLCSGSLSEVMEYDDISCKMISGIPERVRDELSEVSLIKVSLKTGRHHQIRVQLSASGYPIVGDTRYNRGCKDYRGTPFLCLTASELSFDHPSSKKRMRFNIK